MRAGEPLAAAREPRCPSYERGREPSSSTRAQARPRRGCGGLATAALARSSAGGPPVARARGPSPGPSLEGRPTAARRAQSRHGGPAPAQAQLPGLARARDLRLLSSRRGSIVRALERPRRPLGWPGGPLPWRAAPRPAAQRAAQACGYSVGIRPRRGALVRRRRGARPSPQIPARPPIGGPSIQARWPWRGPRRTRGRATAMAQLERLVAWPPTRASASAALAMAPRLCPGGGRIHDQSHSHHALCAGIQRTVMRKEHITY